MNTVKFTDSEGLLILTELVLFRALNDCLNPEVWDDELGWQRESARSWVFSDEETDIMEDPYLTFNYCCRVMNLNKYKIRILMNYYFDIGKSRLRESEYNKFLEMVENDKEE